MNQDKIYKIFVWKKKFGIVCLCHRRTAGREKHGKAKYQKLNFLLKWSWGKNPDRTGGTNGKVYNLIIERFTTWMPQKVKFWLLNILFVEF